MSKKYEKLKQKAQLRLILARQEQIIVELRAMRLCLVVKIERQTDGVEKMDDCKNYILVAEGITWN